MKNLKHILLLLAATALTVVANAQVINGDLNHNNQLDMADMTKLLNNYLTGTVETYTTPTITIGNNGNWFIDGVDTGKPSRGRDGYDGLTPHIGSDGTWYIGSISTGVLAVSKTEPFGTANSQIVGTWYKSPTESITFKSNGTTDYAAGYTYKFMPFQGRILFYNASGVPVASLHVTDVTKDYLAVLPAGSDVPVLYTVTQPVEITLSQTSLEMKPDEFTRLTATVVPSDAGTVTWSSSNESVATVVSGFITAVADGTAVITAALGTAIATCTVTVSSTPPTPEHEYVDLGLSVKWATMNVGASSPEEFGDRFAWGETETKSEYTWETNKWWDNTNHTLIKYNTSSEYSYSVPDNLTQLELIDDAAHQNWGGTWRMPTRDEVTELTTKCTWKWTTMNGVNGIKVAGPSGNSIFLPAVAYDDNDTDRGRYLTSTLNSEDPTGTYMLAFDSSSFRVGKFSGTRQSGFRVRAVCP